MFLLVVAYLKACFESFVRQYIQILIKFTHCEVSFLEFFIELVNLLGILILVAFKILFIPTFFSTLFLLGEGEFF